MRAPAAGPPPPARGRCRAAPPRPGCAIPRRRYPPPYRRGCPPPAVSAAPRWPPARRVPARHIPSTPRRSGQRAGRPSPSAPAIRPAAPRSARSVRGRWWSCACRSHSVIPAQAGIQTRRRCGSCQTAAVMDPRLRGDDDGGHRSASATSAKATFRWSPVARSFTATTPAASSSSPRIRA
ncbi:hypothetical protein WR25_27200 [Diploscapter pachys]|uniref:Uncharacterized protein n=1 Tax=Diploscapter pachys TaxID=2018661 RepID=A0A2A2M4L5_9BILA|nr:hypothetical protein WR25_27200 [Diploscapter pachys]